MNYNMQSHRILIDCTSLMHTKLKVNTLWLEIIIDIKRWRMKADDIYWTDEKRDSE